MYLPCNWGNGPDSPWGVEKSVHKGGCSDTSLPVHINLCTLTSLLFPSRSGFNPPPIEPNSVTSLAKWLRFNGHCGTSELDLKEPCSFCFWPFSLLTQDHHGKQLCPIYWRMGTQALQPTASSSCQTCDQGHILRAPAAGSGC